MQTTEGMFIYGWWLWSVGRYVERNGTKDFRITMEFIYQLTKRKSFWSPSMNLKPSGRVMRIVEKR